MRNLTEQRSGHRRRPVTARFQSGLSLVELMISIVLAMLVTGALATLFANNTRTRNELDKSSRQIESGRYAVDIIAEDLRLAGYYAEMALTGVSATVTNPDPCVYAKASLGWSGVSPVTYPGAIKGYNGTGPTCMTDRKTGTDALVIRRLSTEAIDPSAVTTDLHLQYSRCSSDPTTTYFIADNSASAFTLRNIACSTTSTIRKYEVHGYYVATCNECGVDTIPTLKRTELVGGTVIVRPLVEGVEQLQIDYGFDTNSDGTPDVWLADLSGNAGAADNDWANVVAVKLNVLARNTEDTKGYTDAKTYNLGLYGTTTAANDHYKRHVYTSYVRLTNVAGKREKP